MNPLDQLQSRLLSRADLNGDGKVDAKDVTTVIEQMRDAFADDWVENVTIAVLCFVFGIAFAKLVL